MRVIFYINEENIKLALGNKDKDISWLCKRIKTRNDQVTRWMQKKHGISPQKRRIIINLFKCMRIPNVFRSMGIDDWHEILFESELKYTKGETTNEMSSVRQRELVSNR